MQKLISFSILSFIKILSHLFFKGEFTWITPTPEKPWKDARLMVFLNHTSLYEPLFIQHLSFSFLWKLVGRVNIPGADITLNRPIVGRFWKMMLPNISSVTRKKDDSWSNYLKSIKPDSMILIAPEGRMKRPGGLDKFGKPMNVKGGVADILENLNDGAMILCFSGGLHHIQSPGQLLPRLFKTIRMNLAYLDIKEYKERFQALSPRERKIKITQDLQTRLENNCPTNPVT
jgi:1-acyl-sn-glycerol-3-phosphate acyltransferase